MSTAVAIVKSIVGQVIATSAEGAHRVLVEGDRLYVGDTLDTGAGGMVSLELADGRTLDLGRDTQWSSADSASESAATPAQSTADAHAEVLDVQRAIVAGADPTQDLAPTAAGPGAGGAGGGAAGGSHTFVLLSETAGAVQPDIGIAFTDPAGGDAVVQEQAFSTDQNLPPAFTDAAGNDASTTINVTTDEDVAFNGAFSATDNNGDALTYTLGSGVSHGALTVTPQGVWVYTPAANYNGPDSFQIVVTDGRGGSDTLTVNIGVNPVNDAPLADPATGSATEDSPLVSGQLTASDVDSGDTQTFTLQSGSTAPAGFTLNSNGTWSIDPSNAAYQSLGAGQQLTVSVPFTVTDSGGLTSNSVLTLTITGVNDAPVVSGTVAVSQTEDDSNFTVNLLSHASDTDNGDSLSVTNVAQSGTDDASGVTINADGTLSVNPNAYNYLAVGESVTLTYNYNVVDQNGGSTPASASITIDGVNDAPVVSSAVSATFSEDAALQTINLLQNASDVDLSDSLSVANLQETSGGNTSGVTLNSDGTLSVNPDAYTYLAAGQTLTLSYTYNVIDGNGGVTPTAATLTITGQNDAPVAVADVKSGNEDSVITGNLIANDTDVDSGAVLSVSKFSYQLLGFTVTANAGSHLDIPLVGRISVSANGDFTFTPVANYNGNVPTVTYTLTDGTASTTSTLNITVDPLNDNPVITAPTTAQVSEDGSKVFGLGQTIATTDVDGDTLTAKLTVAHGSLTVGALVGSGVTVSGSGTGTLVLTGSQLAINAALQGLTYKPVADYNGNDLLHITSTDGTATTSHDVAITINPVADIRADSVSINEDNVLSFNAITGVGGGTADNFENAGRAVTGVTQGQHGSVSYNADGSLVYTPDANYNGSDSFTYTVTSGGVTETATVSVTVRPVNDAAVLSDANVHVAETDSAITTTGQLTITDIDSPATFTAQSNVTGTYGTFSITAGGAWTFVANSAFNALNENDSVSETFTVTSADGTPTSVKVTIEGTNDAPVASASVVGSGSEDPSRPIQITLGGSDVDGSVTSYSIESLPAHGNLYANADGSGPLAAGDVVTGPVYFVPTANWGGSTAFDFKAIDNSNASSTTSSATITVTPVADAPTLTFGGASQLLATGFEETAVTGGHNGNVAVGTLGGGQWHTGNSGDAVEIGSEGTYISGGSNTNQVLELERNPGDASNLFTTISADAGETFVVQFQYSPRSGQEANSGIDVYWGGQKIGSLSGTSAGLVTYTYTLPAAAAGNYTLEFRATDSNSLGGLLDNISVSSQPNVGLEDHAIKLSSISAAVTDTDGSESITKITIDDAPAGSIISDGHGNTVTSSGAPIDISSWAKGSLTFTPPQDFNGSIVLHVSATSSEATGGSATTTLPLTVTVLAENDAPTTANQSLSIAEDTALNGTIVGHDTDGDALTYSLATGPAHGTLTLNANGTFTYTPSANYSGSDSFTVKVADPSGAFVNSVVSIGVTPVNDAPVTADQSKTTPEDTAISGQVVASDVEGDSLSYAIQSGSAHGNLVLNTTTGAYTYTPTGNYNGNDSFTIRVSDGKGGLADSVVNINVTPVNYVPTAPNQSLSTAEDTALNGAIAGHDADGDALTYSLATGPAHGTLTLNANGTFTYTPGANYSGSDSFTVKVADPSGAFVNSMVSIGVTPVNDAPVTADQSKTTPEDTAISGQVVASDVEGDSLSYAIHSGSAHGNLVLNTTTGAYTYTPTGNYNGNDSFTIRVSDGKGGLADSVVNINVTPVNDVPTAPNQSLSTAEDTALNGAIAGHDADGDALTYSLATGPAHGTLTLNANGTFTYTPTANYNGSDSFTVKVADPSGAFVNSVVSVGVTPVNDAPVAVADHYTPGLTGQYFGYAQGSGDNLATIAQVESLIAGKTPNATFIATVLNYGNGVSNDLGAGTNLQTFLGNDKASLSADPVTTTDAIIKLSGQVSLAAGSYTFKVTSDDGFILRIDGQDVVKFDGNRGAAATTANYTIATSGNHQIEIIYWDQGSNASLKVETKLAGSNDSTYTVLGASGNTSSLTTAEDTALTIKASQLLGNDSDVDGDTLTLTSVQNNTHGIVALSNGVVTFTPDANYNGEATFQYSISDGKGGTANATVTLNVTAVNDAPSVLATPVALTAANEDSSVTITSAQLLANASDVEGNTLSVLNLTVPSSQGSLVANGNGTWTFTPVKDWNGTATFSYNVSDGTLSTPDTATLVITPVADAVADTATLKEDNAITLNVLGNDNFSNTATITAINGTAISSNGSVSVDHGSVKLVNGQLLFTPTADYHGQSNFTYTVTSGGVTESSTVKLMINSVSDASTPTISVTPKGYWTFDSATNNATTVSNVSTGQTGTLVDSVAKSGNTGNSNIPTLSNDSRATGAGSYLTLNSGSDTGDHIDVAASVTNVLLGAATLTFWINTAQAGGSDGKGNSWNNPSIIGSEQVSGGNDIQWGAINSSGQIGFGLGNVNGVYSITAINDSQWHNIAISRDASSGLVSVYVDGKLEATGSPSDSAFTGTLNHLLEIGVTDTFSGNGTDASDSAYFKGALDDLRIYSGVLTADQIAAINHVENGYQGTAIANATTSTENTLSLSVTDTASSLTVTGLENGMTISDGNGHSATSAGVDSVIDLSTWTTSNLTLGHTGTDSATLIFTGTNTAANGDTSSTNEYLTLANGTSVLATGTGAADTLNGSSASDLLRGGDGNDTLYGLAGHDRLEGGAGNDSLYGGAGNDVLLGGDGNDLLFGGSGNNIMTGGGGADTFTWQAGDVGKSTITDFNAVDGDRINLSDLLPDITDTNVLSYLKVDTATSTIQVSTSGHIDQGADVSITLQGVDLTTYGSSSADIIKSLVAGTDPVVKTDHH
ncbi:VCBS repeat-containing protein [Pseudomonas sp. TE3786]